MRMYMYTLCLFAACVSSCTSASTKMALENSAKCAVQHHDIEAALNDSVVSFAFKLAVYKLKDPTNKPDDVMKWLKAQTDMAANLKEQAAYVQALYNTVDNFVVSKVSFWGKAATLVARGAMPAAPVATSQPSGK